MLILLPSHLWCDTFSHCTDLSKHYSPAPHMQSGPQEASAPLWDLPKTFPKAAPEGPVTHGWLGSSTRLHSQFITLIIVSSMASEIRRLCSFAYQLDLIHALM